MAILFNNFFFSKQRMDQQIHPLAAGHATATHLLVPRKAARPRFQVSPSSNGEVTK